MLSKEHALEQLQNILQEKDASHHLVSFSKYRNGKNLRSKRYDSYHVLCMANTTRHAGWLVCNFALHGTCELKNSLLAFNTTTGGTGRLERHANLHKKKCDTLTLPRSVSQISKAVISRSAALAVALDLRPISFTDKQRGLSHFVNSIFAAGQATPCHERVDTSSLLPSAKSVSIALTKLAEDNRQEYKALLPDMIKTGGAVTTDGVTLKVQDKQFYDLTLHYIEKVHSSPFVLVPTFRMRCRTLLLQEKQGEANAEQLRKILDDGLRRYYGCDMDNLTTGFTMVTDNASVMARVARSSVSTRIAPTEKWMGCLVHQINTALRCCMTSLNNDDELSQIFDDFHSIKKIVRIFKQSNWNCLLPEGFRLIQEVETRFGTTFHVVQRFLKASSRVEEIINSKGSVPAQEAFNSLQKSFSPSGFVSFPALEAVVDAFREVINLQVALQASNHPTIHLTLPKLKKCTDSLRRAVNGGSVFRGEEKGYIPAPPLSRGLCQSTMEWLDAKVRVHPLIMAGCYLNPLFREFQFLEDPNKRHLFREGAEGIIRVLLARTQVVEGSDTAESAPEAVDTQTAVSGTDGHPTVSGTDGHPTVAGRKRTYSLLEYADSHFQSAHATDEISRYNTMQICRLPLNREKFMEDPFAVINFWYTHRATYPGLFKVVLRVLATPVSSCASERVFSALNRIATRDRARLSSKSLEEIIVVRSLLSDT